MPVTNPVARTWLGSTVHDLRRRVAFDAIGNGVHNSGSTVVGSAAFVNVLDEMVNEINLMTSIWSGRGLDWVGEIGLYTEKPNSYHNAGRALDLTALHFVPAPWFMDSNTTWRPQRTLLSRRLYLSMWAVCRRYFGTVLTYTYDVHHHDHFHIDNGTILGPINSGLRTDTSLVQLACNLLNGANISVDGIWGAQTQAAYESLMRAFRMQGCVSPRGNLADARLFLANIAACGASNRSASQVPFGTC